MPLTLWNRVSLPPLSIKTRQKIDLFILCPFKDPLFQRRGTNSTHLCWTRKEIPTDTLYPCTKLKSWSCKEQKKENSLNSLSFSTSVSTSPVSFWLCPRVHQLKRKPSYKWHWFHPTQTSHFTKKRKNINLKNSLVPLIFGKVRIPSKKN